MIAFPFHSNPVVRGMAGFYTTTFLGGYLANTFNPDVPFLLYAALLVFSVVLLAVVKKETLDQTGR